MTGPTRNPNAQDNSKAQAGGAGTEAGAAETEASGSPAQKRGLRDRLTGDGSGPLPDTELGKTFAGGVVVGAVILIPFAVEIHPSWSVLAAAAMFAAASLAGGGLLGLLFGVPRSVAGAAQTAGDSSSGDPAQPLAGIAANTNLEQISDWLTKILVGVSLTQFATIKRNALHLFNAMAPSLGGDAKAGTLANAAAFAGAEVVYFSVLGFFIGWLYARLRLGVLMSNTDALLNLARRASKAGDDEAAQEMKAAAYAGVRSATAAVPTVQGSAGQDAAGQDAAGQGAAGQGAASQQPDGPAELAARYVQLRTTLAANAARTTQLEGVVRQARHLSQVQKFTLQDTRSMFQTGDEGSRVVALGIMQADIGCADLDSVLDAISNSRSAFEQFQALVVADELASTLGAADQTRLRSALQADQVAQQLATGTNRRRLADGILAKLGEPSPGALSGSDPAPTS